MHFIVLKVACHRQKFNGTILFPRVSASIQKAISKALSYPARRLDFRKLVNVLMSRLGIKNGTVEFLSMRSFFF